MEVFTNKLTALKYLKDNNLMGYKDTLFSNSAVKVKETGILLIIDEQGLLN